MRLLGASQIYEKGHTGMGSNGKKKTTMAKLNRENRIREKRQEKAAKKDARKREGFDASAPEEEPREETFPVRPVADLIT